MGGGSWGCRGTAAVGTAGGQSQRHLGSRGRSRPHRTSSIPLPLLPGDVRRAGAKARGGTPLPLAPTWHGQCPRGEFSRLGSRWLQSGELRTLRGRGGCETKQAQCYRLPTTSQCSGGSQETSNNHGGDTQGQSQEQSDTVYSYGTTDTRRSQKGRHLLQLFTLEFYHKVHTLHHFLD